MKKLRTIIIVLLLCFFSIGNVQADPLSYPVKIEKDGKPFNGTAAFKFTIISADTTLWSNDGTSINGSEPVSSEELGITNGIFKVALGLLPMKPLYYEVLDRYPDAFLRMWVNTGNGFEQFLDQPLTINNIDVHQYDSNQQEKKARIVDKAGNISSNSQSAAKLVRNPKVIEEKIARKISGSKGKQEPKNPEGLARERYLQRANKEGKVPMGALSRAKNHIDKMRDRVGALDAGIWTWQWLGPGNIGGRIRTILIHPTSPGRMWIGSVSGGIWSTNDGGGSWRSADDFMANMNVTSLVMDPTNTSTMYAATGEGFGNSDALPGAGIFRSTDGGVTWTQLASTNNNTFMWVNRLAHHPTQANRIFAVTRAPAGSGISHTVQESRDGGNSWNIILRPPSYPTDIKIHTTATNRILVGCSSDVYYSSNTGGSWTQQTTGTANKKLPSNVDRCEVAFSRSNSDVMYVSMNQNGGEIWRSTDGATTWTSRNTGTNYLGEVGWYANTMWVDPIDSDHIMVGGLDLWESSDGGDTLTKISDWLDYHDGNSAHIDQHVIVHHPGYDGDTNKLIYVGNDGGIQLFWGWIRFIGYFYENLANNLGITQFYGGAAAPDGSVIVGGTQDNDKLRYTPSGGQGGWYQFTTGDGGFSAVDYNDTDIIYGEYTHLRIQKSINGGIVYVTRIAGLTDADSKANTLFIAPFVMDPNDPTVLVAGGASIWQTTNSAFLWESIRGPQTGNPLCSAIDIAKGNSDIIWVGYDNGHVARTLDGGTNWDVVDNNPPTVLPNRWVKDIAINPSNSNEVFVTFSGYNIDNVWHTTDAGLTWTQRTGTVPYNLPELPVNTIRYHPSNQNWVYIGTDLGIFASEDKGLTWNVTPRYTGNEGPANVEVSELFWQGGEYLIAATHGRGMFRCRPLDVIFVDANRTVPGDGSFTKPYQTITEAVNAAGHGTTISIEGGKYPEAPIILFKRGKINVTNGPVVID
ncbi:MAG: hypothetical protein GY941_28410 [Planctomycetes bacterium]|nr:hypothetical protein [Planctomycetota bacterium]